jgi:hypothetical protein
MKRNLLSRSVLGPLALSLALAASTGAIGCAAEADNGDDDLTSNTARARSLSFEGVVYVSPQASDSEIVSAAQQQTRTAFGAFREADIAVNTRELRAVDPTTLKRRPITMVDTGVANDPGRPMLEVRYTYKDDAIVAPSYANRSTTDSALLGARQFQETDRVFRECTSNSEHDRGFQLWYVFNPNLSSCQDAMKAEDTKIRADRAKLGANAEAKLTKSEVERLYFPITVQLGADKTNKGKSYPEYDRLYAGGVEPGKMVISLVYGLIDHKAPAGGPQEDSGYREWVDNLVELMKVRKFETVSIDSGESTESAKLASGKVVNGLSLEKIMSWRKGSRAGLDGLSESEVTELKKIMGQRFYKHWITLEAKAKVSIAGGAEKDFTYKVITYFGSESEEAPHKFAIKNSDVYVYNGHSYIGSGPLDPSRFTATDFPKSYQILFVDGCVSYNYYHKGYIPLKEGGTKNLDLITNGLETPSWRSGYASGALVRKLIDGSGASYQELLTVANDTDRMRVVDGELDNKWTPATPVRVR